MLFRCRSRPGTQSPEPSPRLDVRTHALPSASTTVRFVVCPSPRSPVVERGEQRRRAAGRIEAGKRLADPCEPGSRQHAPVREARLDGSRPLGPVGAEVGRGQHAVALGDQVEQRRGDRSRVDGARALVADQLERGDEPRLVEQIALAEQSPGGRVEASALAHRHHRLEHREARRHAPRGSATPARASRSAGSTSHPPRQSPVGARQRGEPGGQAGHSAGRCADRVVHELLAERHLELRHRRTGARRHRDEAVEVARLTRRRVEVDRMAAAEQPRHHGLRDTRRE